MRDRMFAANPKIRFINAHFGWYGNNLGAYNTEAASKFRYPWKPEQLALFAKFGKQCRERYVTIVFCMNADHYNVDWAAAKTFDGKKKDPIHYDLKHPVEPQIKEIWAKLGFMVENDVDILAAKGFMKETRELKQAYQDSLETFIRFAPQVNEQFFARGSALEIDGDIFGKFSVSNRRADVKKLLAPTVRFRDSDRHQVDDLFAVLGPLGVTRKLIRDGIRAGMAGRSGSAWRSWASRSRRCCTPTPTSTTWAPPANCRTSGSAPPICMETTPSSSKPCRSRPECSGCPPSPSPT